MFDSELFSSSEGGGGGGGGISNVMSLVNSY